MPKWVWPTVALVAAVALVPFALIALARTTRSTKPRIHPVQDMDNQSKYKAQSASPLFADGRAMRPSVSGAIARGDLTEDPAYYRGITSDTWSGDEPPWVTGVPVPVTPELMRRGRERFAIFCAACHGLAGEGNGPTAVRADELQEGTWTPPPTFHSDALRGRPVGSIFNTITNGIRSMPAYSTQVPVADRWAIIAYLRALQRSQNATLKDVPDDMRTKLR